jgi:hypothetical protein
MAVKSIRGHALVKRPEQGDNFLWQCECGTHYGAATGDGHILRAQARERHRLHLIDVAGQLAAGTSAYDVGGHDSAE